MTNLVQQFILAFLQRRGASISLPEIMRARGIPVKHTRSQYNATRQLMQRLVARGLVAMHRVRGIRQVSYTLTLAGALLAGQFEAYLAELDAARDALECALGITPQDVPLNRMLVAPAHRLERPHRHESRKVYECPRCSMAISVDALLQRLQRSKGFTCETCGLEQAEAARDFLEG